MSEQNKKQIEENHEIELSLPEDYCVDSSWQSVALWCNHLTEEDKHNLAYLKKCLERVGIELTATHYNDIKYLFLIFLMLQF